MTTGGLPGELGAVYVSVVPSMAGSQAIMQRGAAEDARTYAHTWGEVTKSALVQAMERAAAVGSAFEPIMRRGAAEDAQSYASSFGQAILNVLPLAMQNAVPAMGRGAVEGADAFARQFKDRLGNLLPAVMQDAFLAGSRTMGPALAESLLSGGDIRAAVSTWAQAIRSEMTNELRALPLSMPTGSYLAGAAAEMTAATAAANATRVKDTRTMHAEIEAAEIAHQRRMGSFGTFTGGALLGEMAEAAREASAARIQEKRSSYEQIEAAELGHQQRMAALQRQVEGNIGGFINAGQMAAQAKAAYAGMGQTIEAEQQAMAARMSAGWNNLFSGTARFGQMKSEFTEQFGQWGRSSAAAFTESAGSGLSSWLPTLLTRFGGPLARLGPIFQNAGQQCSGMLNRAILEETAKLPKGMVPIWEDISANMAAQSAKFTQLAVGAGAVAIAAGVAATLENIHNVIKLAKTEFEAFAKIGKDGADTLMDSFISVVKGKTPNLMGAFNVIEEGLKQVWLAPQNVFNTFLDNTIGHIPLIGKAVKGMVSEVEGAFNAIFPLFDELKELSGKFLGTMIDVGTQWQEIGRTIAGQTLDIDKFQEYLGIVQEIGASGLVLHFKDVAQVVGELSQRLDGLDHGAGLTRNQLKELATTVAESNELLGGIHINIDGLTAAFNSFDVPASRTTELLTEFTNISRMTGADINTMIHDIEASGPAFQDLGFDIEQTAFLMAKFNEELGAPAMQRFVLSLRGMPEMFAKLHIDPKVGYKDLIKDIQDDLKNPDTQAGLAEALNDATKFMSKSASSTFVQGVKLGFSGTPEEIAAQMEAHKDQIKKPLEEALEATKSIGDQLEIISTQFLSAFAPMATGLANGLRDAGASITDWIKENQAKIIAFAGTVMHDVLATASTVIRIAGGVIEEMAPLVQAFVRLTAEGIKAAAQEIQLLVKALDALPNWMHLGINTKALINDLNDVQGPLDAIAHAPIRKWGEDLGNAMIGGSDAIDHRLIPSLDKLSAHAATQAQFTVAGLERFKKPDQKEPTEQSMLGVVGEQTYSGTADQLAKVRDVVKDIKGITATLGPDGKGITLVGSQEDLNAAADKLKDIGAERDKFKEHGMHLLGDPNNSETQKQWEDVKEKFKKLGIDIDVDMSTGLIKGVKAGTDKAGTDFLEWWDRLTGNLTIDIKLPASTAAPSAPGHAFGGPMVQGDWKGPGDSVAAYLEPGEYVVRRSSAMIPGMRQVLDGINYRGALPRRAGGGLIPGFDDGGSPGQPDERQMELLRGIASGVLGALGLHLPWLEPKGGRGTATVRGVPTMGMPWTPGAVGPSAAGPSAAGPSGAPMGAVSSGGDAAHYILAKAKAAGFSRDQAIAVLSTAMQESGLDEGSRGGGGAWHGIFQQDTSYPNRDSMTGNVDAFFARLGAPGGDIWGQIFALQQGRPYGPGARQAYMTEIKSKLGSATALYNQIAGGMALGGIAGFDGGGMLGDVPIEGSTSAGSFGDELRGSSLLPLKAAGELGGGLSWLWHDTPREWNWLTKHKPDWSALDPRKWTNWGHAGGHFAGGGDVGPIGFAGGGFATGHHELNSDGQDVIVDPISPWTGTPMYTTQGLAVEPPHHHHDQGGGIDFPSFPDKSRIRIPGRGSSHGDRAPRYQFQTPMSPPPGFPEDSHRGWDWHLAGGGPICGLCGGGHPTGFCHGGPIGFDGGGIAHFDTGGSVGGVLQVIWSDTEDPQVQAAHGDAGVGVGYGKVWSGGPGSPYSDETNPQGQGFAGHHGHVHTTFTSNPFNPNETYGLRQGADIGHGHDNAVFPSWVGQLAGKYGLTPRTYPGHQERGEWGHLNRGIDWYPQGKLDMSGQSYTHQDHVTLSGFAASAMAVGTGKGTFDGTVPLGSSIPGNAPQSPASPGLDPNLFGGTPAPMPPSGGTATGSGPGVGGFPWSQPLPSNLLIPPNVAAGINPYTNLPSNLNVNTQVGQDEYKKWKYEFDNYLDKLHKHATASGADLDAADAADAALDDAKGKEKDAHDKWTKLLEKYPDAHLDQKTEAEKMDIEEYKNWVAKKKELHDAQEAADRAHARVTQSQTDDQIASEKPAPGAPKEGGEGKGGKLGSDLGSGLIKGVLQELGFPDVFGKFFTEWGIFKLGMGALGFGLNVLHDKGLLGGPGGPGQASPDQAGPGQAGPGVPPGSVPGVSDQVPAGDGGPPPAADWWPGPGNQPGGTVKPQGPLTPNPDANNGYVDGAGNVFSDKEGKNFIGTWHGPGTFKAGAPPIGQPQQPPQPPRQQPPQPPRQQPPQQPELPPGSIPKAFDPFSGPAWQPSPPGPPPPKDYSPVPGATPGHYGPDGTWIPGKEPTPPSGHQQQAPINPPRPGTHGHWEKQPDGTMKWVEDADVGPGQSGPSGFPSPFGGFGGGGGSGLMGGDTGFASGGGGPMLDSLIGQLPHMLVGLQKQYAPIRSISDTGPGESRGTPPSPQLMPAAMASGGRPGAPVVNNSSVGPTWAPTIKVEDADHIKKVVHKVYKEQWPDPHLGPAGLG